MASAARQTLCNDKIAKLLSLADIRLTAQWLFVNLNFRQIRQQKLRAGFRFARAVCGGDRGTHSPES